MDNDAGLTAREWLARSPTDDERDAELARLRERLAFYQSFEGLIQDNIARSGDLLRQAMQMRESAASEIAAARADAERQRADDQARARILFSAMLDEVTAVQGQSERLARRLTNALDQLELDGSSQTFDRLPTDLPAFDGDDLEGLWPAARSLVEPDPASRQFNESVLTSLIQEAEQAADDAEDEPVTDFAAGIDDSPLSAEEQELELPSLASLDAAIDDALTALGEPVASEPKTTGGELVATDHIPTDDEPLLERPVDIPADIQPFAAEDIVLSRDFRSDNDLALQPSFTPEEIFPELSPFAHETPVEPPSEGPTGGEGTTNATIVLVHGVPRATTALSLKRYLESLAHVGSVEPREFAEGILRLEVSGRRPLAFDDLQSWSEGATLEPVHLRDDLVEVRLARSTTR